MADQAKSSFSDSLTERRKTGFSVNFFVRDVAQSNAKCRVQRELSADDRH